MAFFCSFSTWLELKPQDTIRLGPKYGSIYLFAESIFDYKIFLIETVPSRLHGETHYEHKEIKRLQTLMSNITVKSMKKYTLKSYIWNLSSGPNGIDALKYGMTLASILPKYIWASVPDV